MTYANSAASVPFASLGLAMLTLAGCFNPPDPDAGGTSDTDATGTTGDTTGSDGVDGSEDSGTAPTSGASSGGPSGCTAELAEDASCPAEAPYCQEGECVGCLDLFEGCGGVSTESPVCDAESGRCVECSSTHLDACDPTQACVNQTCAACTTDEQCPSELCLVDSGECLLEQVVLEGTVRRYDLVDAAPQSGVTVLVTNVDELPMDGPTEADGAYTVGDIPPGTLLDIELDYPQDDPVFVPASLRTRMGIRVDNETPVTFDTQVVPYGWMAKVAYECGLFASLEEAIGNGAVNTYFTQRSTVFGQLVDSDGHGVATVSRQAIQVEIGGKANSHDNMVADDDPNRAFVCFLDEDPDTGTYVGTTEDFSTETGRFVMFRARNADGLGQGQAIVRVSGFDDAAVNLKSTGNIGVVELLRNDDPIPRDFAIDVYPIFTSHTCVGCHSNGGPDSAVNSGFQADWSLSPREVWDNLVGPGTTCPDPTTPVRVCTDDPEISLLVTRPLTDPPDAPDGHPAEIFPSLDDPSLQIILQWIEQGAQPPKDVYFESDVYPLFTKYGCVGCHTNGGPREGVNSGYQADWNLPPAQVYDNLVGPGTTCPNPETPVRICTDDPANSLLVTYPLTDPPNEPDPHPVAAFGSINDPDVQLLIQWIAQGARYAP